ncbi:MAG TPA: hypothetical protein VE379_01360 [Vicinamibacterales bacterium]|nr:hypothetical protein [Vicinamibacterales bacterium]
MAMDSQGSGTTQDSGAGIADQLRTKASGALSQQKSRATQSLGSVVDAIRQTGQQLGDGNSGISGYVNNAAESLQRWTQTLERKDIGEIVEDVQRFGRRQPALFVGLSFGAGLLGARFLKSSGEGQSYGARQSYGDASFARTDRDTGYSRGLDRDSYTAQRTTGLTPDVSYGRDSTSPGLDTASPGIDVTRR